MKGLRLKLTIAYDGTPFRGWQSQAGGKTVQDLLERAFAEVCGERIRIHGAGRTDSGVHALAQCAHVDVPRDRLATSAWREALNAHLPASIRVMRCVRAASDFHARFSATRKIYLYRIWNGPVHPPFEHHRSWHVRKMLDAGVLNEGAAMLRGTHDFAAFAANRRKAEADTVRTLYAIKIRRRGPLVTLEFDGNGFLYKMVRLLTGTLIRRATGRDPLAMIRSLLEHPREQKTSHAAPAEGLHLVRVIYSKKRS